MIPSVDRDWVRQITGTDFIEIYSSYPIEICETRDSKGFYKKARAGDISQFTGLNSPYEPPRAPQLIITSANSSVKNCVAAVMAYIKAFGITFSQSK